MKIAYVCRNYHKRGGVSKCVAELAERLSDDNDVHIFTNSWESVCNSRIIFHKVWMIKKPLFLAVLSFAILNYFRLKKYNFDLICSPTGETLIPALFTAHSCHRSWVEYKKKNPKEFVLYLLNPLHHIILAIERHNYKKGNYTKIIAISQYIKNEIIKYYKVPLEDIEVIYNGVDLSEFQPNNRLLYRKQIRTNLGIPEDSIVLLFIGYEFKRKGLRYLIKAFSRLSTEIHSILLIVGGKGQRLSSSLISKTKNRDRVVLAGGNEEVKKYYAASDIFVFPTLIEPFGLVITEAMASGLAVITTKTAGAAEIITDTYDGLLLDDPTNTDELVKKIKLLIEDNTLRQKIGQNALETIKSYSWNIIAKKTEEFYKKLLSDNLV